MELGGNKAAYAFYEENNMFKDGKVDHESPMHSRWKMELSAKAEAAIKEQLEKSKLTHKIIFTTNCIDASVKKSETMQAPSAPQKSEPEY